MMKDPGAITRYPKEKRKPSARILAGLLIVALVVLGGFMLMRRAKAQEKSAFLQAEALYESEQYDAATTALHDFLSRYDQGIYTSQARYYLASSQQALGQHAASLPLWRQLLNDATLEPDYKQQAAYNLGICLERSDDTQGALQSYQEATRGPGSQLSAAAWLRIGELLDEAHQLQKAAASYREVAHRYPETAEAKEAISRLNEITLPNVLKANSERYQVKRGDVLAIIARRQGSSIGQIMLANGLNSPRLSIGDQLLIPKVRFNLDVGLEDRMALLKIGDFIVKTYPICVGHPDTPTPFGDFRIINKLDRPDWRNPEGILIPYGDPANELGSRWLGIASDDIPASRGFGLHGTIDPGSIGQAISHGCLRFYNEDIEQLFELLNVNVPVRIAAHARQAQWHSW